MTKIAGTGSISQIHGSADPDPDPGIRNTGERKTSARSSPEKSSHEQGHEDQTEIWIKCLTR
jgi:hypothetical protein